MPKLLQSLAPGRRWLLVVAAPREVMAALQGLGAPVSLPRTLNWNTVPVTDRFDLLVTGVGKANAAAAVARTLDPERHAGIINLGIGGALPGSGLAIGDIVDADRCVYADEGSEDTGGFRTIAEMGFGPLAGICGEGSGLTEMSIACAPVLAGVRRARTGAVATVSTCSGADARAFEVVQRTGALVEDMEGAAIGFTAARIAPALPFSAVRIVSNFTGDRASQGWNLESALDGLREIAALL